MKVSLCYVEVLQQNGSRALTSSKGVPGTHPLVSTNTFAFLQQDITLCMQLRAGCHD